MKYLQSEVQSEYEWMAAHFEYVSFSDSVSELPLHN